MSSDRIMIDGFIEDINICLQKAGDHGGRVFGGYVRDVLVPKLNDRNFVVDVINDVDIWFTWQHEADSFISRMSKYFHEVKAEDNLGMPIVYPFRRRRYSYIKTDKLITFIDVIVSRTLPVNDFDVNQLTYKYYDGRPVKSSFGNSKPSTLIAAIRSKTATILPEYIEKFKLESQTWKHLHIDRMKTKYIDRGWKINHVNVVEIPRNDTFGLSWIEENLLREEPKGDKVEPRGFINQSDKPFISDQPKQAMTAGSFQQGRSPSDDVIVTSDANEILDDEIIPTIYDAIIAVNTKKIAVNEMIMALNNKVNESINKMASDNRIAINRDMIESNMKKIAINEKMIEANVKKIAVNNETIEANIKKIAAYEEIISDNAKKLAISNELTTSISDQIITSKGDNPAIDGKIIACNKIVINDGLDRLKFAFAELLQSI